MKNRLFLLAGIIAMFTMSSCDKKGGFKTTDSGLRYKFYTEMQDTSKRAKPGEIIIFHFVAKTDKDSVFVNSHEKGEPVTMVLMPPNGSGSINEGLAMMGKGDSATFIIQADSLYGVNRPSFIRAGSDISFTIKMIDIVSQEVMQERERKRQEEDQAKLDGERLIKLRTEVSDMEKWLAKNNLKATTLPSGLKYVITKKTNGTKIKAGNSVMVDYTGKRLDDTVFDSSKGRGPLKVEVVDGKIIKGWVEGLQLLREGEKAVFVIPFDLGYGDRAVSDKIPAFTTLVFEVEVINIVK